VEVVGEGTNGRVFKYLDVLTTHEVAVKIFTTNNKESYEQNKQELEVLSALGSTCSHIVRVQQYTIEEEDEHTYQIFLVMDLADGTLEQEIRRRWRS
jgi:serine/threonine protein kinase